MEIIAFVLFHAAQILTMIIMTFVMAIPSGIGLGIGLNIVKRYLTKKPKPAEERAKELEDLFGSDVNPALGQA